MINKITKLIYNNADISAVLVTILYIYFIILVLDTVIEQAFGWLQTKYK